MGLILRTTHENMPAGAIVANGRLTVAQMDNNFMFLQSIAGGSPSDLITLTVASASQYISDSLIITGQPYLITDADLYLYGVGSQFEFGAGTNILLYGVDESSLHHLDMVNSITLIIIMFMVYGIQVQHIV